MNRRRLLAGLAAGTASLAGCLSGGSNSGSDVDESRIEECALAYIEANVMDTDATGEEPDVRNVESPDPSVVSKEERDGRLVYEVTAAWGVDYRDETMLAVELTDESPSDATESSDPAFEDADELRNAFDDAVEDGTPVHLSEFDSGYDTAAEAVRTAFDGDLDDGPFLLDHDGSTIEIRVTREPGLHADYGEQAYYHVVDDEVYRAETEDEDPTDGEPLSC